jgi:hypothetical protein
MVNAVGRQGRESESVEVTFLDCERRAEEVRESVKCDLKSNEVTPKKKAKTTSHFRFMKT